MDLRWTLVFIVAAIATVPTLTNAQITCPQCTDAYDPTSCNQTQDCNSNDVCEFHVHTAQYNRVEFVCASSHGCRNHETHPCSPTQHESCAYCCSTLDECKTLSEGLFLNTYSTFTPPTPTAMIGSTGTVTTPPVVTAQAATTPTTTTTTTAKPVAHCIQCGNFASETPCTSTELLIGHAADCPDVMPYCFGTIYHTGSEVNVIKGCAEENFCSLETSLTEAKPECNPLDPLGVDFSCTWCCQGDGCNSNVPPSQSTILTFVHPGIVFG